MMKPEPLKTLFTAYEEQYYRVVLILSGLLYFAHFFAFAASETIHEFVIPRIVMGAVPVVIVVLSFVQHQIKAALQDITTFFFMTASLHVVGFLAINHGHAEYEAILFTLIFFTNLQINKPLYLVIYNVSMVAAIEYAFIVTGFGTGLNPVTFFLLLIIVILICVAFQWYRLQSTNEGQKRERVLSELVSRNPDPWIIFEGNGLIAKEAGVKALKLFGIETENDLGRLSLRNIITAGSPFEADRIIRSVLEGERLEMRTLCRKPAGELFWSELAVYRIPGTSADYYCRFLDITELLKSREVANATAIRYRSYLDTIEEGLIITNEQLEVNLANTSALNISTPDGKELTDLFMILEKPDLQKLNSLLEEINNETIPSVSWECELKNKIKVTVNAFAATDVLENGKELIIFIKPAQEQKASVSGHNTEISSTFKEVIFTKNIMPASTINDDGKFVKINDSFKVLTGYNNNELLLLKLDDLVHPEDLKKAKLSLQSGILTGELHFIAGDGTDKWLKPIPVPSPNGTEKTYIWEDLTDSHTVKRELERAGSKITAIIENTQSPIVTLDFNHRITFMNSAFISETKKRSGRIALTGDDIRTLLNEKQLIAWETIYNNVMSGEKYFEDEMIRYRDGSEAWFETSYTPVTMNGGIITGISVFSRDVTDRIVFQNDLVEAREQAEEATKAKSGFLATMSHEIRTPLNGLLGMTELLSGTKLKPEQQEYLNSIKVSGEALLAIINDVLDFSKIESEKMVLDERPFSISSAISETFDMLRYRAAEKNNILSQHINTGVPDIVSGDKIRLRQVLLNLTGNAIKFTENGKIDISVTLVRKNTERIGLEFVVSDSGIGIPADKMDKLFKSFTQADASTFSQYGGTGLGLAISARLVELMGGSIRAESIEGKGSQFIFTIVVAAAENQELLVTPPTAKQATATQIPTLQVLVAEDNAVNQAVAKAMLEKLGQKVTLVSNGAEAVKLATTGNYPIIFMDVQMPDMDGLEATRLIRKNSGNLLIPVIVAMTANALEGDRERCIEAGMNDYISKPVSEAAFAGQLLRWGTQSISLTQAPTTPDTTASVLDIEIIGRLQSLAEDDETFLKSIIGLYEQQSAETLAELRKQMELKNMEGVWQAAHKLKGASLNLGARLTGEWCRKIEEASRSKSPDLNFEDLFTGLEDSYRTSLEALRSLLK
ncbi:MAG TPA: ATP-binding protein [Bacteroidia bacterium]|nr:ATP-binding protein [Bacteroidia bacterium]